MSEFHGKRVSTTWGIILRNAERKGVLHAINQGRRTMAEQAEFVRQKGLWSPSNPTGAARPSPFAPHIRVGREDHALDVNFPSPVLALERFLNDHGVATRRPIGAEPWHIEAVSEKALIALAKRLKHRPTKRQRLALELKHIRARVRQIGHWTPARQRRAKSIEKFLRRKH